MKDRMISIMFDWQHIFDEALLRSLEQGEVLFRQDDQVKFMYLVREGAVALERPMKDGTSLTLHIATSGNALAEASLFAETYHCDAVVLTSAQIAVVPRPDFLSSIEKNQARP